MALSLLDPQNSGSGINRTTSPTFFRGQVFWLSVLPTGRAFPPRLPQGSGTNAAFVPGYSGGTTTDSHRLPY